ncbi:MAG TPA: lytic transglycosylase domain-containing protein [Pyrinomonadaceae bacterium]|nr:lytic transglycosylase domain-containing protein [Pyrinomonadaceae bacterium]
MKKTKRLLLLCALTLACAPAALAQTRAAYRFDNFDLPDGVRIATPPPMPAPAAPPRQTRRRVRLTANAVNAPTINAADAASVAPAVRPAVETHTRSYAMTPGRSLDGFTTGDGDVDRYIVESGRRNGVDPVLLYAIMHRESAFKKRAISYKGARGLMQLMPGTARRFGVTDIFDPRQNIEAGAKYMNFLLNRFGGNVPLALAGYNAGEGAVEKYGRRVPPYSETREYVRRIGQRYALMRNPEAARHAPVVTSAQVAQMRQPASAAPVTYERTVSTVRLPDGKLTLVSQ